MLKTILNPSGMPLGPLEFSTKGKSVDVHTPNNQKVSNIDFSITFCEALYQMKLFQVSDESDTPVSCLLYLIPISHNSAPRNFVESAFDTLS